MGANLWKKSHCRALKLFLAAITYALVERSSNRSQSLYEQNPSHFPHIFFFT